MSIIDGSTPSAPAALALLPVAVFHPAFEHRAQLLLLERFGAVVVHAGGATTFAIALHGVCRDRADRHAPPPQPGEAESGVKLAFARAASAQAR